MDDVFASASATSPSPRAVSALWGRRGSPHRPPWPRTHTAIWDGRVPVTHGRFAESVGTTTPATTSGSSVTFSGTVTNIVTGVRVGGATVTIGSVSATSSADGSYSLAATAAGQPAFSVAAPGYYTRNSQVSMVGSTTINPEIIPQGDGFDLVFFDWLFRENGTTDGYS
jgi:hypothetical protein